MPHEIFPSIFNLALFCIFTLAHHNVLICNFSMHVFMLYSFQIILDVIKYCDHPRWYEKIPPGGGTSNWRWDLQLEVSPPIRGGISNWRWDLQLEVGSPIRGDTSNWRWDLQSEVGPAIGDGISNQR